MTQGTEQALFGELRSMLAQADKDPQWAAHLIKLLGQGHERLGQEQYEQVWLPYLVAAQASLPQPLCTWHSLQELERACLLAPWASFALQPDASCDVFALAASPYLSNLTELDLNSNGIGAKGAAALAASPYLSNLTELDLTYNGIGAKGAAALAASPYLSQLTRLVLLDNEIGDEGAAALAASPYLCEPIRRWWKRD
jgi:Leucine-rich repeat (LRR) protein